MYHTATKVECTALLGHPQEAETEKVEVTAGRAVVAIRRPAAAGGAVPTAAPSHADRARGGACRISCSTIRITLIPVLYPLPDIAMHVIESPGVGLQLPHRVRLPS